MSTDSTSAAEHNPETAQESGTSADPPEGFAFGAPSSEHEVTEAYSWRYFNKCRITRSGRIKEIQDTDGVYGEDSEYSCECGAEFDTKDEALRHLRKYAAARQPPVPTVDYQISWADQQEVSLCGVVQVQPDTTHTFGRVLNSTGTEFLAATARARYEPPNSFAFESWGPLVDGRMQWPDGTPLFRPQNLTRALDKLVDGRDYIRERYTIHFGGHRPLVIEGPSDAIIVAPTKRNR